MNSASFVFLAALAVAALLGLLARTWSHDRARYRAMVAHEQTGQTQAGWDARFAWGATSDHVGQAGRPTAPVTVTAAVVGHRPPKWWKEPAGSGSKGATSERGGQQSRASDASPARPAASLLADALDLLHAHAGRVAPRRADSDDVADSTGPRVPALDEQVIVDGQPATVTSLKRVGRATRVHLRRSDGQLGFVDIPDVDTAVPVAPSDAPTGQGPRSPVPPVPAPEAHHAVRPAARPSTAQVAHPAVTTTRPAPPATSMTVGGITISLGDPAPTAPRPAPQDLSLAEQRRRHLAAHGYTGPTDADGLPLFGAPDMATRAAG